MNDYEELVANLRNCAKVNSLSLYKRDLMKQAADAIEELQQNIEQYKLYLQDAINDLRSAHEKEQKWISVTERLPEEAGSYLVAVHQDDIENAEGYSLVLDAWYNPKTYPFTTVGWTLLNEWYDLTPRLREEITHWMYLPEPPKEE